MDSYIEFRIRRERQVEEEVIRLRQKENPT